MSLLGVFTLIFFLEIAGTRITVLAKLNFVLAFVAASIFISWSTEDSIAAMLFVVTYLGLCLIGVFLVFTPSWLPFHLSHDSSSHVVFNLDGFWLQIFMVSGFDCDHGWWQRSNNYSSNVKIKCVHDTCVHKRGVCGNSTEREVNQEIKRECLAFQGKNAVFNLKKLFCVCVFVCFSLQRNSIFSQ